MIPGAVGGDVIKAAYLGRMQPDMKPQAWASMVLDRILGLLGLFLLAGVAGLTTWNSADGQVRLLIGLVWGALLVGFVGLAVVFSPGLYRPLNRLVAGRGKLRRWSPSSKRSAWRTAGTSGRCSAMLGVATFCHGLYVLAFYTASLALFDSMPTLAQHYLMVPLTLFTTAVPLPFGALGLSEQISGRLFQMVHHADGAVAMMAFRVLMYASGAVSACVYLANLRQVRTLQHEARQTADPSRRDPASSEPKKKGHTRRACPCEVTRPGFEPGITGSEPVVIPFHHRVMTD